MSNIAELLIKAGVPRTVSHVIAVLSDEQWYTMRQIERIADLRQPEVSKAVMQLSSFVRTKDGDNTHGRPEKVVMLKRKDIKRFIAAYSGTLEAAHMERMVAVADAMKEIGG